MYLFSTIFFPDKLMYAERFYDAEFTSEISYYYQFNTIELKLFACTIDFVLTNNKLTLYSKPLKHFRVHLVSKNIDSSYVLWSFPTKICQSRQSLLTSHCDHKQILMSAFH